MAIFTAIATAISGALFAGSVLATSLISSALAFGAQLAVSYLNRPKKQKYTAVQGEVQFGANVPAGAMLGTGKVVGHRIFYAKWGSGNKINADVFVLANGWNDGLEPYVYFYGEKHDLVTRTIIGNETAHYGISGFSDAVSIRFYDGRPGQGVDAKLVADTAGLSKIWKSTSVCAGHAYVVVERTYSADLFPKGRPDFEWVLRGLRLYDPRKDSTIAGGSGPHRLATPSTWEFSKNPALQRLNYQLGIKGLISGRTIIGEGKSLGQIDLGTYFVAMNVCDSVREGKKTYESAMYVDSSMDHTEILKEFDDAMAGYGLNRRGLSGVIPGAAQIPVLEITAADIPIDRAQQVQRRKSAFELYNYMSGQFTSIESNWAEESLTPVYVNADIAADGRPRQTANDFLQVTDPDIAQYLLNIRYRQNRRGGTATVPVSRRVGLALSEGEWVTFQGVTWLITEWQADEQFRFTLVLAETSADIYDDGDIDPGPIVIPPTPPINPSLLSTVAGFNVEAGLVQGASGSQVPCLRYTWTPPQDPTITAVRFFYTAAGDVTVYEDQSVDPEKGFYVTTKNVASGKAYTARATITTVPDRFKTFTAWITTLTSTGNLSVLDGSITATKIADAAITAAKIANEAVTNLKLADAAVTEAKIAVDAVTRNVIKNGEVITSKIADGAMTLLKFGSGLKPVEGPFTTAPTTGNVEGRVAIIGASPNGKLMRYTGGAWTAAVDAVDLVGTIDTAQIAAGAITTAKIADLAIVAAKIGTGEISATKIADGAIINSKLGPLAVDAAKIATNAITNTKIADDAISTPKLQANAVVADKIAANSIGARQLIISDLSNLIPDSELSDIANWTVSGGGAYAFLASVSATYDGPVLRFSGAATADAGTTYIAGAVSKDFPVNEGQEYAYGGALDYSTGTTGGITITIRWYDVAGTWFETAPELGFTDYPDAARHLFSGIATAPATAVKGRFYVRRRSTSAAGSVSGNIYAYMLYVRRAAAGELIVDGAITAGKIQANSITGDKIVANTIGAKQLIIADLSNMVPDSALSDISGWTGTGSGEWSFSNTSLLMAAGRKASATGTWTTSSSDYAGALWSDYVPCEPGKDYAAGFVIDPEGGATGTLLGTLDFYDRDKVSLGFGNINSSAYDVSSSTALVSFSKIITSPADAAFVRFRVRRGALTSGGTAVGNVHFGSFYIRRAAAGELIVDGAISADKITANAITSSKIAADAVTAGKIAANAVTSDTITANAITSTKIAANSIAASHVQANVIGAKQLIVADFSNLILDSALADVANWSITAGVFSFVNSTGFGSAGGKAIRSNFSGISAGAGTTYVGTCTTADRIPVESNKEYAIGGYINPSTGATGTVRISIYFYDKDNVAVGDDYVSLDVSSTTAEVPISKIVVAPTTAAYCAIAVRRYAATNGGSVGTGYVYTYNVFLRRASNGELIVDGAIIADKISSGAITTSKIAAGAVTATTIATGAITAVKIAAATITGDKIAANTLYADLLVADSITSRELILTDYSNLVVNGSFDTGDAKGYTTFPSGWDVIPNTNSASSAYTNCVVPFMARIAPSAAAGGVYFNAGKAIDCKAGDQFSISARAAISSGGAAYTAECLRIIYYWKQADGSYTAGGSIYWPVGVSTSWTNSAGLLLHSVTAPSGAVGLRVRLYYNGTGTGATGNMVVSQCYVRRKANAELIIDGAIISDKIATNAITADKINVTSLSAISANLGSVNIEDAIIGTLTVGTSNIEPNAVTASASMSGNSAGIPEDTVSLTGMMNNSPALISIVGNYSISASSGASGTLTMSVVNTTTGSTAWSFSVSYGSGNTSGGIDAFRIHSNTNAGTNNYELNISGAPGLSVDIDVKFLYWRR